MRWPQFLLTLINLTFAVYVLVSNVFLTDKIDPISFLWSLIYLSLAISICHLYMLYMSNKIDDWYDVESIKGITNLSIISMIVCSAALLIHMGLEYYQKKGFTAPDKKSLKALVPLISALACSAILFTSSIKFKKYVILCKSTEPMPAQTTPRRNYHTTD